MGGLLFDIHVCQGLCPHDVNGFNASVSPHLVSLGEKWIGCVSHQLIICMMHVMGSATVKFGVFGKDLEHFKKIVDTFKKAGLN